MPQCLADKARLNIGQPDIIGRAVPADRDRVAVAVIRANSGAVVGTALSPTPIASRPSTVADDPSQLEDILRFYAEKFRDAPGAARA